MSSQTILRRFELVMHHERHLFSSRCSKSQHAMCSGNVSKKRVVDGECRCPCHRTGDLK